MVLQFYVKGSIPVRGNVFAEFISGVDAKMIFFRETSIVKQAFVSKVFLYCGNSDVFLFEMYV